MHLREGMSLDASCVFYRIALWIIALVDLLALWSTHPDLPRGANWMVRGATNQTPPNKNSWHLYVSLSVRRPLPFSLSLSRSPSAASMCAYPSEINMIRGTFLWHEHAQVHASILHSKQALWVYITKNKSNTGLAAYRIPYTQNTKESVLTLPLKTGETCAALVGCSVAAPRHSLRAAVPPGVFSSAPLVSAPRPWGEDDNLARFRWK